MGSKQEEEKLREIRNKDNTGENWSENVFVHMCQKKPQKLTDPDKYPIYTLRNAINERLEIDTMCE